MTLRWPAHRTSQSKVPCTWGFLTNMLVMAPWPVFACFGFVSSVCPLWSLSVGLTVSGACAVRSVFLEQRPSAPCTRSLGWGRGRTCWEETCSLELQAEHEMRGGMRRGGSRREGLPAEVRAGGGAGSAQPWRPRECAEQRLALPQGRPQRGSGEEGRAVSCIRASTWLPALRTPLRLPPPQSPGGHSALRLLVGVKKCRCRDFRNVVGDSDF